MPIPALRTLLLLALLPSVAWAQAPANPPAAATQDKPAQSTPAPTQEKKNAPAADKSAPTSTNDATPKIDAKKEAHIRELLDLGGTRRNMVVMLDGAEKSIKPLLMSSFPPGEYRERLVDLFFQKFRTKFTLQDLINDTVPLYDKNFTDEEIVAMLEFYRTPTGQKVISVLPGLLAESQQMGAERGRKAGEESMKEVLVEHPELLKALEDAKK